MLLLYLSLIETQEDKRLFENIYTNYKQRMFKYAFKLLKDEGYAEDVVHDVFLSIIKRGIDKIREIDNENHLWNYLYTAVRNQCITFAKRYGITMAKDPSYNDMQGELEYNETEQATSYNFLVKTIRSMDPTYADVLYYSLLQGMKSAQIAELLGLKPATVRQRISRGKKILQERLGDDYTQ